MSLLRRNPEPVVTAGLIVALAVQNAVPPFATDMYSPAFPEVTADLGASASAVGLTLTAFFIGMALGHLVGGAVSDQRGRRGPMILGGLVCTLGALVCAFAPTIGVLMLGRVLQGFGGGAASVVGRAVLVDLARGSALASTMSILMAVQALAPMIAPVIGGAVLTVSTWRVVFWCLVAFGLFMTAMAWIFVPESLPREARHDGGLRRFVDGFRELTGERAYLGYMLTSVFSGFGMFAYISSSSFVLQEIKGLSPLTYSIFFGATAGCQMLLSVLNARLVRGRSPRSLMAVGLTGSAVGVAVVTVSVLVLDVALVPLCCGFVLLMGSQAFVFGNSSAMALSEVAHVAGVASAFLGVAQAVANGTSAPLASAGGSSTAVPMVAVMLVGVVGAWASHLLVGRVHEERHLPEA